MNSPPKSDLKLKVVPMRPKRNVPEEAKPLTVEELVGQLADQVGHLANEHEARLRFIEKLVLGFRKDLSDLHQGVNFSEARLNKTIRLANTLAIKAGIPE